jgi:hypothetical protein
LVKPKVNRPAMNATKMYPVSISASSVPGRCCPQPTLSRPAGTSPAVDAREIP